MRARDGPRRQQLESNRPRIGAACDEAQLSRGGECRAPGLSWSCWAASSRLHPWDVSGSHSIVGSSPFGPCILSLCAAAPAARLQCAGRAGTCLKWFYAVSTANFPATIRSLRTLGPSTPERPLAKVFLLQPCRSCFRIFTRAGLWIRPS